ncbi:hypothetical protein HI914_00980 [Erysiphe necator]|nr:hypothetical protein HI914_00980 [Erysiphe necator]
MNQNPQTPLKGTTLGVQTQNHHSSKPRMRLAIIIKSLRQNTALTRLSLQSNTSLEVM